VPAFVNQGRKSVTGGKKRVGSASTSIVRKRAKDHRVGLTISLENTFVRCSKVEVINARGRREKIVSE